MFLVFCSQMLLSIAWQSNTVFPVLIKGSMFDSVQKVLDSRMCSLFFLYWFVPKAVITEAGAVISFQEASLYFQCPPLVTSLLGNGTQVLLGRANPS